MKSPRLGVNIDHVATVRNARGEIYPSPLRAALLVKKFGGNSVTLHLREDRRHINDNDLHQIKKKSTIPINLEIAPTEKMLKIALKYLPNSICIVPEKRKEITTEGGLNLNKNLKIIKKIIKKLKKKNIRTSLFIEANMKDIKIAKKIDADCVELHTGKICNLINKKKNINYANKIGLEVHAGHGINFQSAKILSKINGISEYNIGHFIVGESIFIGLKETLGKFKKILKK